MKNILTRPAWQIFLLWMVPTLFPFSNLGLVLTICWLAFMFYFIYFLCISLYEKLPAASDLSIKTFKLHFFFLIVYTTFIFIVFDGGYEINQNNYKDFGWKAYVLIPLHCVMMYCIFYILWFISKSIVTIEKKRITTLNEYVNNIFLLVLWPIGIFWVHPKVRKIFWVEKKLVDSMSFPPR